MELLSAVIYLDVANAQEIPSGSGPLVQGWFFKTLRAVDKLLAENVHKNGGYSLSGIMQDENGRYIRIASLRSDLTGMLLSSLLPGLNNNRITLDATVFKIRFPANSHALQGQAGYAELGAYVHPDSTLSMEFASPTAFRTSGMDLPLPMPYHVLHSWWKTWNKFAPEKERIGYPLHLFAENCIAVNGLQKIETVDAPLPRGHRATGFTGQVTFTLQPAAKCEEWASLWKDARRDWQKLAAFAFYAGTGQHTSCGMGQTHPTIKTSKSSDSK